MIPLTLPSRDSFSKLSELTSSLSSHLLQKNSAPKILCNPQRGPWAWFTSASSRDPPFCFEHKEAEWTFLTKWKPSSLPRSLTLKGIFKCDPHTEKLGVLKTKHKNCWLCDFLNIYSSLCDSIMTSTKVH